MPRLLTILGLLVSVGGCETVSRLGDWCDAQFCPQTPVTAPDGGGGREHPPSRDEVCEQGLWGCQWKDPRQQSFLKPEAPTTAEFGSAVVLSADGQTLVAGAPRENRGGRGIDPLPVSNSRPDSGAAFVFRRQGSSWVQEAYLKASNSQAWTRFGSALALSADGNTLAVGAPTEKSNARGVDGDQTDTSLSEAGAVYVFERQASGWVQRAYVKATNTEQGDFFGAAVALSGDGRTLSVGAPFEASGSRGVDGNQNDNSAVGAGAVYMYRRQASGVWVATHYLKASNADALDSFGAKLAFSGDGHTLAVGAPAEDGCGNGVNPAATTNDCSNRGAVYVFEFQAESWTQKAYVKPRPVPGLGFGEALALSDDGALLAVGAPGDGDVAANLDLQSAGEVPLFRRLPTGWAPGDILRASPFGRSDHFGFSLSLSSEGSALVVGAPGEDGAAYGANGDASSNLTFESGAAYLWVRNAGGWTQMAYLKASNTRRGAEFGEAVAISGDAATVAIGSALETTESSGVNGAQLPDGHTEVGAVYVWLPR